MEGGQMTDGQMTSPSQGNTDTQDKEPWLPKDNEETI